MNVTLITCIILGSAGVFCIGFLLSILWKSLPAEFRRLLSIRGFKSYTQAARLKGLRQQCEEALALGQHARALELITVAFANPAGQVPVDNVDHVYQLHLNLLAAVVGHAQRRSLSLEQLPILEDLVHSRNVLLSTHKDLLVSYQNMRRKRTGAGKHFPGWAQNDYEERIRAVINDIEVNRLSIVGQLDLVFREFNRSIPPQEITFH